MLRIRLRRTGKIHQPSYRVVVADQRAKRDGDFVEILGHYNPRSHPKVFEVNQERVKHWLSVGAQPSDTVHRLFADHGVEIGAPAKRVTKPSKAEREAAAAAEAARQAAIAEAAAAAAAAEAAAAAAAAEAAAAQSADAPAE
ncbi:MAG: 30S ribosomal protein S16 [Dehalococcoidia bacterium]|nr:30S ribosomal protein S16 [Dehalococcoidia bacterium]